MFQDTLVNVGANPTAIATYPGQAVRNVSGAGNVQITTTTSGTTRAIVANSGANTVSILDLVNGVLLTNITVGNHPVALAVSSDGSTAYVANYADSTVTQVNLNTGTVTATIAISGQPTSVALTSAGILWVGGSGFISEINTQTMAVTATQSTAGKNIIALGYSNGESELVATSADTSGNVYQDEISPSTVLTSAYAPAATHAISSLGSYQNAPSGTLLHGYTAMLAGSAGQNSISATQAGAPPLAVQDGWAVISATPTGFTITDISGHIVLVSETTPSPVTAIALDTNLNAAYLVMPDSNTLLTVPLPGTGTN